MEGEPTELERKRRKRLRRGVRLCMEFIRNVNQYRAGWTSNTRQLLQDQHPDVDYWRQSNSNFFDQAVLDWCKLFGDGHGKHRWKRLVSDPDTFWRELLKYVDRDDEAFQAVAEKMKHYRDKFVAHLDDDDIMNLPEFATAISATHCLYDHIVKHEARPGDLSGLVIVENQLRKAMDSTYKDAVRILDSICRAYADGRMGLKP